MIDLSIDELREIARFAAACAGPALTIYERDRPGDPRARAAVEAARDFAAGARRTKHIRDTAWAAHRAAQETRDAGLAAASEAARAAVAAASAAYLHPLAKATQVIHILGAAAHTARALELDHADPAAALDHLRTARDLAGPTVIAVLTRYPDAPPGRARAGELTRTVDRALRDTTPIPQDQPPREETPAP